jgi:4-hydroxy-2-oxoglutarate aldolase
MSHSMIDLRGVLPPIPTPFDRTGAIDRTALASHLSFLRSFDLAGYVVLGSNGEAVHLSIAERSQLLEAARDRIPENRLLIAGTGCSSTWQTIEVSQSAASLGVDAVLVLPPHYYKSRMTLEALREHFHAVADAVKVPVILYNMPACTGLDMDVSTVAALAAHPNIIGLKDSGGNVAKLGALHQLLGAGFQILAGSASFLLPALSVGAAGGVLALANIAPAQCLAIRERALAGDWASAREIQVKLIEANTAVTSRWGVAGLKDAMKMMDLPESCVRAPLLDLKEPHLGQLKSILTAAHILPSDQ